METMNSSEFPSTLSCLHNVITLLDYFAHSPFKSPILSLICWWTLCLYFKLIVLNLFPLFILIWFSFRWKNVEQTEKSPYELMLRLEQILETMRYFSWKRGYARKSFIYFIYTYIAWISLQQILPLSTLFILVGSFFIIWRSEWTSPLKKTYRTMKHRFTRDNSQDRLWNRIYACQQDDQQTTFSFELYENQRFNVFSGQWEGTTFPFERSPWTDSVHHPISSKSQIILPFFWSWIDDEWSADEWSYGTIIWTTSIGNKWYHNKTRRRLWTRKASTVDNGSTRRRSSVFYSQQSTVYDLPADEFDHHLFNSNKVTVVKGEEKVTTAYNNNEITPQRSDSPFRVFKPQHDSLYYHKNEPITQSSSETAISKEPEANELPSMSPRQLVTSDDSSFRSRRSKRISLTTGSREAIWKSIVQI